MALLKVRVIILTFAIFSAFLCVFWVSLLSFQFSRRCSELISVYSHTDVTIKTFLLEEERRRIKGAAEKEKTVETVLFNNLLER